FFSSRRRHTRFSRDWSSDVCSSDLFPIGLYRVFRDDHLVVGPAERRSGFKKQDRFPGNFHPALGGMLRVIQSDADDFGRIGYTRTQPDVFGHIRTGRHVDAEPVFQPLQTAGFKKFAGVVFSKGAYIIPSAVVINDTRALLTGVAKSK